MSKWQEIHMDQYCEAVKDGTHDSPKKTETGKLLVTSKNIKNSRLELSTAYFISEEDFHFVNKRSKVDRYDILLSMIGTVGEVCIVENEPDFAIKNVGLLKCKTENEAYWLYYYLKSPDAQQKIKERLRGTTQLYLPLGEIRAFPVRYPADEDIADIAVSILKSIDQKIELNQRMNETLEGMARAIFKSWFVDFDPVHAKAEGRTPDGMDDQTAALFPSTFTPDGLPSGWTLTEAEKIYDISIGKTPPRKEQQWFTENPEDIEWLSIRDMGGNKTFTNKTSEYLTKAAVEKHNVKIITQNTVFLSFKLTVGRVQIASNDMCTNEAISHFNCKQNSPHFSWTYCYLKQFDYNSLGSTSSIATAVNSKTIKKMPILRTNSDLEKVFSKKVESIFEKIRNNEKQNQTLATLRDTLLPKLISGELRVDALNNKLLKEAI